MSSYEEFVGTKFETATHKVRFAEAFKKFVGNGFQRKHFPKWFYKRLSITFGMIAHYDQAGFYEYYFEDHKGKEEFLRECLNWPCYGDPEWTYSDAERHLQAWLREDDRIYQILLQAMKQEVA